MRDRSTALSLPGLMVGPPAPLPVTRLISAPGKVFFAGGTVSPAAADIGILSSAADTFSGQEVFSVGKNKSKTR